MLFGGVKITKNATDTSKHKYEGYGICFDECGTFSKGGINNGKNVLILGVHENSLVHANNKANNIYVMGDLFVQCINDTTFYAEKLYSQNFTAANKEFVLSLHYNGDDSYFCFMLIIVLVTGSGPKWPRKPIYTLQALKPSKSLLS